MSGRDYCPGVPDGFAPTHESSDGVRCALCGAYSVDVSLLRHALGVRRDFKGRWSKPYRNRYAAGESDVHAWRELERAGLALRSLSWDVGHPMFRVTGAGREVALDGITFKRKWGYGTPTHGAAND